MAQTQELQGGPYDGAQATDAQGAFCWFDEHGTAHASQTGGTALYRWKDDEWIFAGHDDTECDGCQCIVSLGASECPLCGHAPGAWVP